MAEVTFMAEKIIFEHSTVQAKYQLLKSETGSIKTIRMQSVRTGGILVAGRLQLSKIAPLWKITADVKKNQISIVWPFFSINWPVFNGALKQSKILVLKELSEFEALETDGFASGYSNRADDSYTCAWLVVNEKKVNLNYYGGGTVVAKIPKKVVEILAKELEIKVVQMK